MELKSSVMLRTFISVFVSFIARRDIVGISLKDNALDTMHSHVFVEMVMLTMSPIKHCTQLYSITGIITFSDQADYDILHVYSLL